MIARCATFLLDKPGLTAFISSSAQSESVPEAQTDLPESVTHERALHVAVDAASGDLLWSFDPEVKLNLSVTGSWASRWNRGVAVWNGKVIAGTGAPRVGDGKVFIGNAAADFGLRGYVTAYAADSGDQLWRFYTVPRAPALGQETEALEMAAKTWSGDVWHQFGGGGPVWDSMTFDSELNRLYIGTDGALPWDTDYRNPEQLDNLFTNSIVALDAATGEYLWHYQTVPADEWDYNAASHMVLADMEIGGEIRKILMQAPKNGFFYVIDRVSGESLSAYKVPRAIQFVEDFPKTSSGKVMRRKLHELDG